MNKGLGSAAMAEVIAKIEKELHEVVLQLDYYYKQIKEKEHHAINLKQTLAELKELQYGSH
jgi:hypothetical protein